MTIRQDAGGSDPAIASDGAGGNFAKGATVTASPYAAPSVSGLGLAPAALQLEPLIGPTIQPGGDLTGSIVTGLGGSVLPANVANGFLKRNNANGGWEEVAYGAAADTVCQGNDSRLADSRSPAGTASGDLSGSYPGPTVAGLGGATLPANAANGFLKRNNGNTGWEQVAYGSAADTVCQGNDSRLSDSRAPSGAASGSLAGSYPGPTLADNAQAPSPTAPSLAANWANAGGSNRVAGYWRNVYGVVRLEGIVTASAGAGTTVFTLPTGYRPSATESFPIAYFDGTSWQIGVLAVLSTGVVRLLNPAVSTTAGNNLVLSGVAFRAA